MRTHHFCPKPYPPVILVMLSACVFKEKQKNNKQNWRKEKGKQMKFPPPLYELMFLFFFLLVLFCFSSPFFSFFSFISFHISKKRKRDKNIQKNPVHLFINFFQSLEITKIKMKKHSDRSCVCNRGTCFIVVVQVWLGGRIGWVAGAVDLAALSIALDPSRVVLWSGNWIIERKSGMHESKKFGPY